MVTVNAMGDKCPVPVIKTKKALDALTAPETIEVFVDNETAVANDKDGTEYRRNSNTGEAWRG